MSDQVEEIKNRLDIIDVIGDYIKLEKTGANHRAVCPFHSEEKPSFFVSPSKQIWKCFGCGKGGDVYAFVEEIEGVGFAEALQILAKKAGVKLERLSPEQRSKNKRLYEINDLACRFFEKQLQKSKKGEKVFKYLTEKRKISKDSIAKWRLGYAPDKWRALSKFLTSCGYNENELLKVGLMVRNEKGNSYDRFRGRVMFSIFDLHSRVIGFSGRVFPGAKKEQTAKYVNVPNTPLYNKSKVLFGLSKSKVAIRKKDSCVIAEGYTDVILSHQEDVKNIVSASGTALTSDQLNILKRYTESLSFAFDMDTAGSQATKRGVAMAQEKGFNVEVILMPGGHDPADVIAKNPSRWDELIKNAKGILDFYFERSFENFDKEDSKEKKKTAKELLPVIKRIPNEIERAHWSQELAKRLGVTEKSVEKELRKIKFEKKKAEKKEPSQEKTKEKPKLEMLEEQLLFFFFQKPESVSFLEREDLEFFSPEGVELFSKIKKVGLGEEKLKEELSPGLYEKVKMASLKAEVKDKVEDIDREVVKHIQRIKGARLKRELRALSNRLREAERAGDEARVRNLTEDFNEVSKKIKKYDVNN